MGLLAQWCAPRYDTQILSTTDEKTEIVNKTKDEKWRCVYFSRWNLVGTMTQSIYNWKDICTTDSRGRRGERITRTAWSLDSC